MCPSPDGALCPVGRDRQQDSGEHAQGTSLTSHSAQIAPSDDVPYQFDANGNPQLVFRNSEEALAYRRRVTMPSQLSPSTDPTIMDVFNHREAYVAEMIRAMYNLDGVRDKPEARERKLFDLGQPDATCGYEVEAACRVLFDTVIDRCCQGYRGATKDNKAGTPRNYESDRDGNCTTRIQNVINCLRQWKAACRDILCDDYRCILLANHPLAYAGCKVSYQRNNNLKKVAIDKSKAVLAREADVISAAEMARVQGNLLPKPGPASTATDLDAERVVNNNRGNRTEVTNDHYSLSDLAAKQAHTRMEGGQGTSFAQPLLGNNAGEAVDGITASSYPKDGLPPDFVAPANGFYGADVWYTSTAHHLHVTDPFDHGMYAQNPGVPPYMDMTTPKLTEAGWLDNAPATIFDAAFDGAAFYLPSPPPAGVGTKREPTDEPDEQGLTRPTYSKRLKQSDSKLCYGSEDAMGVRMAYRDSHAVEAEMAYADK
ncbi:hypothetical protein BU26DRAFT_572322 [Trematosphaeria pertusa]|uniref:Uncharacterized protein n=1 Tax=Trematosphaeria pertusa TaxID=390896 RepID=A0A6A6HTL4_9PLEO|nr:uncharacterized protein BU26DRAFT_572322 [Trematosphaeria pertusa]KAF2241098.1 hypothetical protein BU26DRAFT_572322 [Trematosphaeria pertusa]